LAEVRERVVNDYRTEQGTMLAKSTAEGLAQRAMATNDLVAPARNLGLEARTSELVARGTSITDIGATALLGTAFSVPVGQTGDPVFLGANWVVYRVLEHQAPNMADLANQTKEISDQMLQTRRQMAYEAFRTALENRLKSEGRLEYNNANLQRLTNSTL
jgi:hypothetical protein